MRNSNIDFPFYFKENQKFKKLEVESTSFVKYSHNNAEIQDILLKIHQPFLLFVRKGQVILSTKDKVRNVYPEEFVLINKGHYVMSEYLSEKKEFEALLFFINPYFISVLEENKSDILNILNSNLDVIPLNVNMYVKNYIQTFFTLFDNQNTLVESNDFLKIKAQEFLFYLEKNMFIELPNNLESYDVTENERLKKIIENKWEDHNIKELAFLVHMSESKFKRKFKEVFNQTPGTWIRLKKLQKAQNRLISTDDKIYLIAMDLGFKDEKYFSKLFKKNYGLSPNDYRNQTTTNT